MGRDSKISWCHHTFNLVWGCSEYSPGCTNCYAREYAKRMGFDVWGKTKPRRILSPPYWREPLKWNSEAIARGERARVFCASMADWAEDHPMVISQLPRLWDLIRATPGLDWLLLSKRVERIRLSLPDDWGEGYPHVWLGTTIERADYAWRADELRRIPAAVRFISYEPALGPIHQAIDLTGIGQVIYGGESGGKRRADCDDWAVLMRRKCRRERVAFFYKQAGGLHPGEVHHIDGITETIQDQPRRGLALPVLK